MKSFRFPILAVLASSFVACGYASDSDDPGAGGSPNIALRAQEEQQTPQLDAAVSVLTSPALAEALVLYDRSLSGTRVDDFAGAGFIHVPVVDFKGRPFEDLVFASGVTPHPESDYTSCEDGTLTVAVGATRAQVPVSWSSCGSELLTRIQSLIDQIGADQVDTLLAAEASTYLLRTRDGEYWSVGTGEKLSSNDVDNLRATYEAAWADAEGNGTPDLLSKAWDVFQNAEQELLPYVRQDGSLDMSLVVAAASGPSILEQSEVAHLPPELMQGANSIYSTWTGTCYWFIWLLGCDNYEHGYHADPRQTQAHYPNQLSGWTVPKCVGSGTDSNVAGCGPAAFAAVTDWLWRRGTPVPGAGFSHGNEPHDAPWNFAARPNQFDLYKRVEKDSISLMHACSLGSSGTLVLPWDFINGANAWFAANTPGITMNAAQGTFGVNFFLGETFASPLRSQIGQDRGPALAAFKVATGSVFDYHYSPVKRYWIDRPYGWFTKTRVETIDGYTAELTNPWSAYSAVLWPSGNIGGCRFGDERYAWSCNGPIAGYNCIQIKEPSDPYTWNDNYLCTRNTASFSWSYAGPIGGMSCTQILETADPHTWSDNYLCTNGAPTGWSSSWHTGSNCFRWSEPSDPHTWHDNFLCVP